MTEKNFATRMGEVSESATFKYSARAKKPGVVNTTQGLIDYPTPKPIRDAAIKAMEEGKTRYTSTRGIPELRETIAEKLQEDNSIPVESKNVHVSAGAKMIIFEAIMALIGRGDKVAMPNPSWVSYESIVKIAEGETIWLPLEEKDGFIPCEKFLNKLENSEFKLLLLNSPNNPTGAVYPKTVIKEIVDIAQDKNAWILSDEIYEKIIYEGEHYSPGKEYDKVITVNGFSKEFSMTGWRLGYAACPEKEIIDKMNIIQSQSVSCPTSFVQHGALEAYTPEVRKEVSKMVKELGKRRDKLVKGLQRKNYLDYSPQGSFYVFPKLGENDLEIADQLLEKGIGVVPGSPFGSQGTGCVRMSYGCLSESQIEEILEKFQL